MGKMPTNSLGKSSELKLHCFCLFDAYSMPKDICSVVTILIKYYLKKLSRPLEASDGTALTGPPGTFLKKVPSSLL